MTISNLKIGARLGLAFGSVLMLLTLISAIGIYNMSAMDSDMAVLVNQDFVKAKLATVALDNLRGSIARVFEIVSPVSEDESKTARERLKANLDTLDSALTKLGPMLFRPQGKEIYSKIRESQNLYSASVDKTLAQLAAGNKDEATRLAFGETYKQLHACAANIRDMIDFQQKIFQEGGERTAHLYISSRNQMFFITLLAFALGVIAAIWITRSITTPVDQAVAIAETIAGGDLTVDFSSDFKDETGQLIRALHAMRESLLTIVSQVSQGSATIRHATSEISQGNLDLSERTEMQASALEETASSMEQLTSTVRQNADNARQADKMAQQASEVAIKGGNAVSEVVNTMDAINASSKKIVDIISVIDGIAFQTNILALNAAVEAARAGEQGRGFAVVASEVRNLAQRSAAAAKEIKELIGDSVEKVETGSRQVDVAGATMNEVVRSIRQVTDIMGEITSASQEQSQGIDQINTVVTNMDSATQQNAALVEQAAAAAAELSNQANSLMNVISVFKISGTSQLADRASIRKKEPARRRPEPARAKPAGKLPVEKSAPARIQQAAASSSGEQGWEEF